MAPPPEHHERHIVGAAVHGALLRLCGGGIVLPPAPADRGGGGVLHLPPDWHRTLRELARKSVSFPNGRRRRRPRPGGFPGEVEGGGGKPHDIEVRAALSLYNRFAGRGGRPDRRRQAAEAKAETAESGSAQSRLQMVSNMGLHRPIRSATGLASLLAQDMERNGAAPGSSGTVAADAADDGRAEAAAVPPLSVLCNDVRSDASGIICLITKSRMDALRQSGRLPCPLCTKWCRGRKGLWWHRQMEHGTEHGMAAREAADAANCLAIIPYEPHMLPRTPECPRPPEAAREHRDPGPASDPFEHARRGELEDLIRAIRETGFDPARETDGHGSTCLHWAAGSGHLRVVKHLIESCSCCPDAGQQGKRSFRGRTALHWAARNGKLGVVQYLVEKGASVDAKTIDGTTAFCWASWQGHLDVMQYLHARGSDVHASNSFGCNAILWAAQGVGGLDVMRWLHSIRCDIFQVNANGHSVVHKSAQRGNRKVIEWMCSSHKRRSVSLIGPDQEGCRPSDLARMEGHSELAGWLRTLETTLHVTR